MATLTQFASMVVTDRTRRAAVSRKQSSKASLSVRVAATQPRRPPGMISSRQGSLPDQDLEGMPDLSSRSEGDDLQRGLLSVAGRQSLERTEESAAAGRREFILSSLVLPSLSALAGTSTREAEAAEQDTMRTTVTLYSNPLAFNPAKAKLALEEHGIKYTEKYIDIFGGVSLEPWYLKINPNSSVPSLVAGDVTITESADILRWTDEQGKGPLGGDMVDKKYIADWISKVDAWDGNLFLAAFGSLGPVLGLTTEHKIKLAGAFAKKFPDLAELYTKKANSIRAAGEDSVDKAKGEANKAQLVALLDEAETRLRDTKYLAGDEYSNADVIFTACLYRLSMVSLGKELLDRREHLKKYWLELKERPSYKKTFSVSDSGLSTAGLILPAFVKIYFSKLTGQY